MACDAPLRQLVTNAGLPNDIIIMKVLESADNDFGYDVANNIYCNMIKAGIIDPTKVTRSALQNAASIAGLLLVTDVMITEERV